MDDFLYHGRLSQPRDIDALPKFFTPKQISTSNQIKGEEKDVFVTIWSLSLSRRSCGPLTAADFVTD